MKKVPPADSPFWWLRTQDSNRRVNMYRIFASSLQLLLLGNAGGIGFVVGLFPVGAEPPGVHWIFVLTIIIFMLGVLSSAVTMIFVGALTVKEVHASEAAMYKVMHEEISLEESIFYTEESTYRIASGAMASGILSVIFMTLGALICLFLLAFYY